MNCPECGWLMLTAGGRCTCINVECTNGLPAGGFILCYGAEDMKEMCDQYGRIVQVCGGESDKPKHRTHTTVNDYLGH